MFIIIPQVNLRIFAQSTLSSKFIVFAYTCSLIFLLWAFKYLFYKNKNLTNIKTIDLFLFLLLIYVVINRFVFQSNYIFSLRYYEILGLFLLYVILRNIQTKHFLWFFAAIVFSGLIQSIYGIIQLQSIGTSNNSSFIMTGSFFNPGPFSWFLATIWPISLSMYLFKDKLTKANTHF